MFQTANPSTEDVYLCANNPGSFAGYYYFAGWDSQGPLGDGSLGTLSITVASVPEPSSIMSASIAAVCVGAFVLARKRKVAPV